jgi:hypothetical protein
MLPFFAIPTSSIILGLDYGSHYLKAAVVSRDSGVHISSHFGGRRKWRHQFAIWNLSNPSSSIPSVLSLSDIEDLNWELFDDAQSHIECHPSHGFHGPVPLFDRIFGFRGREMLAIQIRAINSSIDERPFKPKRLDIVMAVFPWTSIRERLGIAEAVKLANGTLVAVVEAHTAVAHFYAREKRAVFSDGMKDVLFVDIGGSHTWMALFRFEPNGKKPIVTELALAVNETLGGGLIDERLCMFFVSKLELSEEEATKGYQQLLEEARKTKELLTVDESVTVKLDEFRENASVTVTRDDLTQMIYDFQASLSALYATILEKVTTEIQIVEVIGGASRVPFLKDVINQLWGKPTGRTLNADEAVALGAAYVGAMGVKPLKLPKIRIDRSLHSVVRLVQSKGSHHLFDETSKSRDKTRKTFTVGRMEADYVITADNDNLTFFHVEVPETALPNDTVRFTFGWNRIGAPIVQRVDMGRNLTAKLTFSPPPWLLNSTGFQDALAVMRETGTVAENRLKFGKLKSDMEEFLSATVDRLNTDELLLAVMNDAERLRVISEIEEAERWYDSVRNEYVRFHVFAERFRALKSIVYDYDVKCQLLRARRTAFDALNVTLTQVYTDLTESWKDQIAFIPAGRLTQLWGLYNSTQEWFDRRADTVVTNSDMADPQVLSGEIEALRLSLEDFHKFAGKAVKDRDKAVGAYDDL